MEPEKLNLWDRIFNRKKKIIVEKGTEEWNRRWRQNGQIHSTYNREFVVYKIVDRVTGSETLEKEYLD